MSRESVLADPMSLRRRLFEIVVAPVRVAMARANAITVRVAEVLQPRFDAPLPGGETLHLLCPNPLTLWRAQTLLTKEPDTVAWIDGFSPGDVMFDVGANIGVYSLYAGKRRAKVYAFEPESQNFALLNRNIFENGLQEYVLAYNIGLNRTSGLDVLQVSAVDVGRALHTVGTAQGPYTERPAFRQGIATFSLDDLIYARGLPVPQHLKIDVDGLEPEIVAGAARLLADVRLRSVLIELDSHSDRHMAIVEQMQGYGMRLSSKAASPVAVGTVFEDVFNHIFVR